MNDRQKVESPADKIARIKREILARGQVLKMPPDPLSGPELLRYAARNFTDNGDGTMTIRRECHLPK